MGIPPIGTPMIARQLFFSTLLGTAGSHVPGSCSHYTTRRATEGKPMNDTKHRFPAGWDEARVRDVIEHYESQTEDELAAEIEAAFSDPSHTVMVIPNDLVPAVRALLAESRDPTPASTAP